MTISLTPRLLNVDEYHKMAEVGILKPEDRVELIEGQILEMSPIGSRHAACVNIIVKLLNRLLEDRAIISGQNPIRLENFSEPEPDIAILKPAQDFYARQHPTPEDVFWVIEVADASLAYDREIKLPLYARSGIPEYWIVNLPSEEIEVYREPIGDAYKSRFLFRKGDQVDVPGFAFSIPAVELLV